MSSMETALVQTGATISFELFTSNYAINAQSFGLPLYPTDVSFSLVTAPINIPAQFAVTLAAPDASTIVAFDGPLGFTAGYLSSADFQGAVSTLQGHLHLSSTLSQDLFGGGSVRLNLQNTGGDLYLGLSPFAFRQDLFFSLSGGPLTVGAMPGAVTLDSPAVSQFQSAGGFELIETVPEPDSGWLLGAGGAMLCGVSALLNRLSQSRR
ncbi:MAG: hypothetical protein JWO48_2548 [Bryobacterales bacterium]|nr:hypothetical protein [Bryobacterales bacterium]